MEIDIFCLKIAEISVFFVVGFVVRFMTSKWSKTVM